MKEKKVKDPIDWGNLRQFEPVSDKWGFDRGLPVDRFYIERFLEEHASDIRGHCLEMMNDAYIRRFGGDRVEQSDALDINTNNTRATIYGDLADPETLGSNRFDCFILTQTLHCIRDMPSALANSISALKPGGTLLITVPILGRFSPHPTDYWRLTHQGLEALFEQHSSEGSYTVSRHGNLVTSIAFLVGAAAEELEAPELEHFDERYPMIVAARFVKCAQDIPARIAPATSPDQS